MRSGRPSSPSGGFFFTTTMGDIKGGTGPTYRSIHPAAENAFKFSIIIFKAFCPIGLSVRLRSRSRQCSTQGILIALLGSISSDV